MTQKTQTKTYQGGCHCGAVRFEADLDLSKGVTRCNCSICTKVGKAGIIVSPSAFRLLSGEKDLRSWGTAIGRWRFCEHCGVHPFGEGHLEFLGGDYVSVNVLCLHDVEVLSLRVGYFDGRHDNWMAGLKDEPWPILGVTEEPRAALRSEA